MFSGTALAGHVGHADVEMFGHFFLDEVDVDRVTALFVQDFAEQSLHHGEGQFLAGEGGEGGDADEGAFETADVGADAVGQEIDDVLRQLRAHGLGLFAQNGQAGFDVGRLHFGDQAPFKAGNQALLQVLDFRRGAVAGEDDLFVGLVQGVEGVEEFLLDPLLAGQELDIVNEQHVGLAVFAAEADQLVVLDGVNVFVGEFLRGKISDAGDFFVGGHMLADGVEQVRLAQSDSAVKEQRVVGFAGGLGDRHGGGCEFDLSTGLAMLECGRKMVGSPARTNMHTAGIHLVTFANVDERLTLVVDGLLPFGDGRLVKPRTPGPAVPDDRRSRTSASRGPGVAN